MKKIMSLALLGWVIALQAGAMECKELPAVGKVKSISYLMYETSGTYRVTIRLKDLTQMRCVVSELIAENHKYIITTFNQPSSTYATLQYVNVKTGEETQLSQITDLRVSHNEWTDRKEDVLVFTDPQRLQRKVVLVLREGNISGLSPKVLYETHSGLSSGPQMTGTEVELAF